MRSNMYSIANSTISMTIIKWNHLPLQDRGLYNAEFLLQNQLINAILCKRLLASTRAQ